MCRPCLCRPTPIANGFLLLLLPLFTLPSAFGWNFGTFGGLDPNSVDNRRLYVLKKSESPQWEDLGWAWGKRSAPNSEQLSSQNNANWDDLGWAWGKRSLAGGAEATRRAKGHGTDPILSVMANRVVRSMSKQSPDWHDLGWAWGRRK